MLLYRELAEQYFSLERSPAELLLDVDAIARLLSANGTRRVLDAGCGSGEHAAALSGRGFQVTGLDRSLDMIRTARVRFASCGDIFVVEDWDRFVAPAPFDAVTCLFGSLGYRLKNARVERSLRSFRRALRPGGVLLLELWHAEPLALAARAIRSPRKGAPPQEPIITSLLGNGAADGHGLRRRRDWSIFSTEPFVVRLDYTYQTSGGPRRDRHFLRAFREQELRLLASDGGFAVERLSHSFEAPPVAAAAKLDRTRIRMIALLRAI